MSKKICTAEQIILHLRKAEVLLNADDTNGTSMIRKCSKIDVISSS